MIEHLVKGLRLLGERWFNGPRRWIGAGENWLDTGVRAGMVAGAGYVAWRLLASSWAVLTAAVLVVVLMALRAATRAAKGQQQKPAQAARPDITQDQFVTLAHELTAGAPGVHLATLAAVLSERHDATWDTADVRALCGAYSIPVQPSVRDARKRVSTGVHGADLPPLPQPSSEGATGPVAGVVAAGQPTTTPPATPPAMPVPTTPATPTVTTHGGVRIVARDDPDNPARTHVSVIDSTRKRARS